MLAVSLVSSFGSLGGELSSGSGGAASIAT